MLGHAWLQVLRVQREGKPDLLSVEHRKVARPRLKEHAAQHT